MNRTETMKAHEFNTGLALIAVIDEAIKTSPELLDADARKLALAYITDLLADVFHGGIKNAEEADRENSSTQERARKAE